MARPESPIDIEKLKELCTMQCTNEEIAEFFGINPTTLTRRKLRDPAVRAAFRRGGALGKISLRRKQYQVAMEGSVPMLIWLGKTMLKQREATADEKSTDKDQPVEQIYEFSLDAGKDASERIQEATALSETETGNLPH